MVKTITNPDDYTAHKRYDSLYKTIQNCSTPNIEELFEKAILKRESLLRLIISPAGFQQFTQDGLNILNPDWEKIAVNVSGGADSCLLTFLTL